MASPRPAWCQELPRPIYAGLERVESGSDWFEVYEVRDGVFALYEPFQFEEVISYLVLGQERALLFDSGLGIGRISQVVSLLTTLPVTVLNSHTHLDHIGGNAEFDEVLGLDHDYSRSHAAGLANSEVRETLRPEALCADLPPDVDRESYRIRSYEVARWVADGERIDLGGRDLEVVLTPGHTPDSLMLLDSANGLLFTGDSFYEGPIYLFAPETDRAAYQRSIDRVAALVPQLDLLLPAHNTPMAAPTLLLELQEALRAIDTGAMEGSPERGRVEYRFDRFSILVSP